MATTYTNGQSIGTFVAGGNSWPLIVKTTTDGKKVVAQVITAKDGKVGYVLRGKGMMLASSTSTTRVSGFVDADADQFEASAYGGLGEPTGLSFSDIEYSYDEATGGTRVWQLKSDVTKSAISAALESVGGSDSVIDRSAPITDQITAFVSKYWIYIVLAIGLYLYFNKKGGKKRKRFSF